MGYQGFRCDEPCTVLSLSASADVAEISYTKYPPFSLAALPTSFSSLSVGWSSRVGLQPGETAFASLQRWWMLLKHKPDGARLSGPARMLQPR